MDVLILVDRLRADARADETDALVQARAVELALARLGHASSRLEVDLDLAQLQRDLRRLRPDAVFNLSESPGGRGAFIHLPLTVLECEGIATTGAASMAMLNTSNKLVTKQMLVAAGLPTASWVDRSRLARGETPSGTTQIIKSVWEHGSVGLDEDSVIDSRDAAFLLAELDRRLPALGGEGFVEAYVDGREFNLSLLVDDEGPALLPPAEIRFPGYASGRRRVVGYRAKWAAGTFEYDGTPRHFDFVAEDGPLLDELGRLALGAWEVFDLAGHVRVDFRVDAQGQPFILEVNANPCLSPDAGFAAAAGQGGLEFEDVVRRLLDDAVRRREVRRPTWDATA